MPLRSRILPVARPFGAYTVRMSLAPDLRACLSVPMTAVAMDGRFDLQNLVMPADWELEQRTSASALYRFGSARLRLYDFGAAVLENCSTLDADLRAVVESATGRACLLPTTETTLLLVDPARDTARPRVGWDRVVVRDGEPRTFEAVAHLLAQSAALDRYAQEAERVLEEAHALARVLETRGRLPRNIRELNKRVGRILSARLELARWFFLIDRPESAWQDPRIYELHEALADNLELKERHQAILHKLEAVEESVDTLMDLWQGRRSLELELTIVVLIVFEIFMAIAGWS
jgi:uncharacterized Rmd1/YagE family protein